MNEVIKHQQKMVEMRTRNARHDALEALELTLRRLKEATKEIERYRDRYLEEDNLARQAAVVNWTVNHLVSNIQPNLRIDTLASAQAGLLAAAAEQTMLKRITDSLGSCEICGRSCPVDPNFPNSGLCEDCLNHQGPLDD